MLDSQVLALHRLLGSVAAVRVRTEVLERRVGRRSAQYTTTQARQRLHGTQHRRDVARQRELSWRANTGKGLTGAGILPSIAACHVW